MRFCSVLFVSFLLGGSALADIVRYTDETGATHYVDSAEKVPEQYRGQLKDANPLPRITRSNEMQVREVKTEAVAPQIEVFVTAWCPYCQQLEAALKERNIPYKRYDIEKSAEGRKIHSSLGGGGIPVTRVGSEVIRGFNLPAILRASGRS